MRIVQVANFYSQASGGLRTTMETLAQGYADAGHESTIVIPNGERRVSYEPTPWGTMIRLPATAIPRSGG